jgi:hypothetical protein
MSGQDSDNIESKLEQAARNAVRDGNGTNLNTAELSDIVPGIDPEIVRGEDSSGVLAAAVHQHNQQHQDRGDGTGQHHHQHAHELSHHQIDPNVGGQRDHQFHHEPNPYQHVQEPPPPAPQQPMPHERRVNRGPDGYPEPSHHGENSRRRIRLTWTPEETQALIQGCRIHGVGNWKKILTDPSLKFNSRTAVDLKDRFRTSFPEEYSRLYPNAKTHRFKNKTKAVPSDDQAAAAAAVAAAATGEVPPPPEAAQDPATALANVSNDRGLGENLVKINRKERRAFTKEEDEQLLKGFQKHGPCWSKIQKDHSLNLFNRRSTDLRDRFRNRFPEKYTEAGYKGRGGGGRVRKKRNQTSSNSDENAATLAAAAVMNLNNAGNDNNSNQEEVKDENVPPQDQQQHQQPTDGFNYYQNAPMMQQIYQQSNQRQ